MHHARGSCRRRGARTPRQDELTKQANDLKEEKSAEPALGEAFEGRMEDAPMLVVFLHTKTCRALSHRTF